MNKAAHISQKYQYDCVVPGSGWSSAAVAGVSAAVVILLVAAAAAAVIYYRKRRKSEYYIQLIEQDGNNCVCNM